MHLVPSSIAPALALALALGLAACSPAANKPADAGASPASDATPAAVAQADGPPPPCSTGRTKAVTEICDDANPALFRAINESQKLLAPTCVWYTEQLMISDAEFLVFRNQDCSAEGWDGAAYGYSNGKVMQGPASSPNAIDKVILEILPLGRGQNPQQVAMNTLSTAPETERARCMIRPVEDAPMKGVTFQITPDDDYMVELSQAGQAYSACGDYGVQAGPGFDFFEQRADKLLYHRLDDTDGYWDAASFTFYRKDAAGAWKKLMD